MEVFTYLVPLIVFGFIGLYYLRIYQKGKAAGGGMMAGFTAAAHEKWQGVLMPGETIAIYGAGTLWRPEWQALLASQIPLLRLVWPTVMFQMCVTDRGRLLMGKYGTMGGLSEQKGYDRSQVRLDNAEEEKPGLALRLNPLYQAFNQDQKTYGVTLALPEQPLKLYGVTGTIVDHFRRA